MAKVLRRLALLALVALLCATPGVRAQSVTASQTVTASSTAAVTLTGTSGLTFCRGVLEGGNVRMTLDGTTSSATVGRPVYAGERILLNNAQDVQHFSVFATSTATTTISMQCGGGTVAAVSVIETPTINTALPLCNPITRAAGNCRG